jgi:hypothetical protein
MQKITHAITFKPFNQFPQTASTWRFRSTSGIMWKHQNHFKACSREQPTIFKQKYHQHSHFIRSTYFADNMPIVSARQTSTEKLPPHHSCLVHRVGKQQILLAKELLNLQPVVRTFTARWKDSKMLQESWSHKMANLFSRTRHVR